MKKLRWGILSTAEIARKNWKAIKLTGNSTVTAVASRGLERSDRFINQCQAEVPMDNPVMAYGSYAELVASKEVDAVYFPLPTALRKEWVLKAAKAGKHVICEKPCGTSVSDLEEMLAACRESGVQFMDDVMFVHSNRFERMLQTLKDPLTIGQVRRISSAFSFPGSEEFFAANIRVHSDLEPDGCLGDLGWYCIRFSLWAMNWQMPRRVSGHLLSKRGTPKSPAPVPTEFSGELLFDGGVSASFYCSFITDLQQWAIVGGTKGYLQISDFVLPFKGDRMTFEVRKSDYKIDGCDFRMETQQNVTTVPEWSHGHDNAQEVNCFRNFANQVLSGKLNDHWPEQSLKTQRILEACLKSSRNDGASVMIEC